MVGVYDSKDPHRERMDLGRSVSVRIARAGDVDYIRSLSKTAFQEYGPYEEMLPDWFTSGITVTLLAMLGERPVGFAMIRRIGRESRLHGVSELLGIAVEPPQRKRGIGDLLLSEMQKTAHRTGVETLVLHTAIDNLPGRGLFKKHGFNLLDTKSNFYPRGQDAVMMYKDIHLESDLSGSGRA
ncbi:MAG: GNAT family N-acetyltransferase [Deltaproteobacteria bacterium]|nr:GNAT family N-acetyltransferase [Deltaproteobacteria bacterium]